MADNRIYGTFKSYAGITYDIYIYDAQFVAGVSGKPYVMGDPATGNVWGDPTTGNVWGWDALDDLEVVGGLQTMSVKVGGFDLEYETQNENLYTPLMPSKVTFTLMFENADQETFLNSLANAYEGQHLVRILKNSSLYWCGVLIPDVVRFEDQYYPYEFQFTAIDGLARLKSIEYPNATLLGTARETLFDIIYACLDNLETKDFWSASDEYFINNTDWWEIRHVAGYSTDPLQLTRFKTGALYENNGITGAVEFFSCYKMLEQICTALGARLFLANGSWYFQQVTEYDYSVQTRRAYDLNKTLLSSTGGYSYELTVNQTTLARAKGAYEFLPPLRSVRVTYKHRDNSATLLEGVTWDWNESSIIKTIGEIDNNGGSAKIKFKATLEHVWAASGLPEPDPERATHTFRIELKVGSYYYVGSDTSSEWTTTPGYYTLDTAAVKQFENYFTYIEIVTSELPATGTCTISFEYVESAFTTVTPSPATLPLALLDPISQPSLAYWVHESPIFIILAEGNESNGYDFVQYAADNTNASNTQIVDLTLYFGDGPYSTSISRMETSDGSTWDASTLWGLGTAGTRDKKLLELLAQRIMQAQRVPRLKYIGTLISTTTAPYQPYSRLKIGTKYYVFLGGLFNADTDTWNNLHIFNIKDALEAEETDPVLETPF